eukprot:964858-Amphidinium_carterae.1
MQALTELLKAQWALSACSSDLNCGGTQDISDKCHIIYNIRAYTPGTDSTVHTHAILVQIYKTATSCYKSTWFRQLRHTWRYHAQSPPSSTWWQSNSVIVHQQEPEDHTRGLCHQNEVDVTKFD